MLRPARQGRHAARRPRAPTSASPARRSPRSSRGIDAEAGRVVDATGRLVSPPFVDPHFHMDATLSYGMPRINASGTLLEGIALWGELKPLLTHEAVRRARARLLRLGGVDGPARHPQPCRHLRRPRCSRVEALLEVQDSRSRPISTCSSSPSRRTASTARPTARENTHPRARHGRRRRRRHPAFRAHHGRRHALGDGALRDRRRARPDGRHALRRDRRPAVAPHRDARLRDAAPRPAGPGGRLAPHLDAFDGQLLRLEAAAADRRGRRLGDPQPADQHHAAGPPRHLSEAPRHDPRAGDDQARASASASARIACSTPGIRSAPPTCSTSPSWACTSRR